MCVASPRTDKRTASVDSALFRFEHGVFQVFKGFENAHGPTPFLRKSCRRRCRSCNRELLYTPRDTKVYTSVNFWKAAISETHDTSAETCGLRLGMRIAFECFDQLESDHMEFLFT